MTRRRAGIAKTRRRKHLHALHAMWDYEDRQNGRGRYAPHSYPRGPRFATRRSLGEVLALVAVWGVVLYVVLSG
jgi:hypothetical protein